MKLWEFVDELEDAPELKTVQQVAEGDKIQQVYANRDGGEAFYHVVTNKNGFQIFNANLDLHSKGEIPDAAATIQGVDFNARATAIYLGTDTGKVYKYAIAQREIQDS